MALRIAQTTLLNGVTNIIKTFPTGIKGFLIGNESGFTCDVQLENGDEKILYPGYVDYFAPGPGFSGIIFVRPSINIQTAILYPSQTLWVDAVSPIDDIAASSYPMALPRPMTAGTTSPQTGFSTFINFNNSPGVIANRFMLNLFNPNSVASQIIARLWAIQIKQTGVGSALSNLSIRTDGTDNNFANAATIAVHNIGGTASTMHATFANNVAIPAQNSFIGLALLDNDLYDYAIPPDAYYLNPRQNITLDIQDPPGNCLIFMCMKWSEQ